VTQTNPKPRWHHLSPDRLIVGFLAVEGFLLLSEQFQWFAFNEKKGWTVLIAVALVCLAVVVMLLWLAAGFLFRLRFQFSVRWLVVLVVAVAIPSCWLTVKMRQAERQRQAVEAIRKAGGVVFYDFHFLKDEKAYAIMEQEPPTPAWLRQVVGNDFFSEVHVVFFDNPEQVGDDVLERIGRLRKLKQLRLSDSPVTDVGLKHLTGRFCQHAQSVNLLMSRISTARTSTRPGKNSSGQDCSITTIETQVMAHARSPTPHRMRAIVFSRK